MKTASDITPGVLFKRPGKKNFHKAIEVVCLGNGPDVPKFKRGKLLVTVSSTKKFIFTPNERFIIEHETVSYYSLSNN